MWDTSPEVLDRLKSLYSDMDDQLEGVQYKTELLTNVAQRRRVFEDCVYVWERQQFQTVSIGWRINVVKHSDSRLTGVEFIVECQAWRTI